MQRSAPEWECVWVKAHVFTCSIGYVWLVQNVCTCRQLWKHAVCSLWPHENCEVRAGYQNSWHSLLFSLWGTQCLLSVCVPPPSLFRAHSTHPSLPPSPLMPPACFASTKPVSWSFNFLLLVPPPPLCAPLLFISSSSTPRLSMLVCHFLLSSCGAWKDKWKTQTVGPIRIKDKYWKLSVFFAALPLLLPSPCWLDLLPLPVLFMGLFIYLFISYSTHVTCFISMVWVGWVFHLKNMSWEAQLTF